MNSEVFYPITIKTLDGTTVLHYKNKTKYIRNRCSWWTNEQDRYHNLDGPAIELEDGSKEWWINGEQMNCSSQEEFERRIIKLKAFI